MPSSYESIRHFFKMTALDFYSDAKEYLRAKLQAPVAYPFPDA